MSTAMHGQESSLETFASHSLPARLEHDTRSSLPRFTLLLDAPVRAGDRQADGLVHDLSQEGLRIECAIDLDIGDAFDIDLSAQDRVRARVMWLDGNVYGCRFDVPISAAVLGAARLRSAPPDRGEPSGDDAQESLARRLRRLRKQNGFSQGDLAERIGVSKPTVWAWEHGRARPQEARLKGIAEALGTTIEDLDGLPSTDNLAFLMTQYREQIAAHFNVAPAKVKIMIEF